MPALNVTCSLGGKTKPIPMTVTPTDRQITDKDLQAFVGDGKTGPLADLLSAFCPHEQAVRTCIPASPTRHSSEEWRQKYQKFGEETTQHIEVLHGLIQHPGVDPMYVSPAARMDEFLSSKIMEPILILGSVDIMTLELPYLDAVILAKTKNHANWKFLKTLAEKMPDSETKQAVQSALQQLSARKINTLTGRNRPGSERC